MITKLSAAIASRLIKLSDDTIAQDQLDVYIYGLECFFNTFITVILLVLWGLFSHTLRYTLVWVVVFSLLRHFTGGIHAPTQFTCILSSFLLGCFDKWAIVYLRQTLWEYLLLLFLCILFAPADSKKISLSLRQKRVHKLVSVLIIGVGLLLFCKNGATKLNATIFYSFSCVIFLMILELIKNAVHSKK